MPLVASILSDTRLCIYILRFYSARLKAHFYRNQYPRLLKNIILALLLGTLVYEVYGVLDFLLFSQRLPNEVALVRISSNAMILTVYGLSFLKLFKKYYQIFIESIRHCQLCAGSLIELDGFKID
jgi:hypothetical protein